MITYSIIQKSQLEGALRLDAEYYQPEFLDNAKKIERFGFNALQSLSKIDITKGETPLWRGDEYMEKGTPFLRSENLVPNGLDLSNLVFISDKVNKRMKRSKIYTNDVLVAIVGATIGQTGLVGQEYSEYNSNQAIAIIRPQNQKIAHYLSIILETKICQLQIERLKGGGARDNLDLHEVKVIKIPKPNNKILSYCDRVIDEVKRLRQQGGSLYSQAEKLLLEELGLTDFEVDDDLFSIVNLSDVKSANRIDAEYFQPKYEKLIKKIENRKNDWDYLENLSIFINNGNQPPYSENGEIKFFSQKWIKDKEIDYSFLTDKNEPRVSRKFFENKINKLYLIKQYDILYYSVGANLGFCHNYLEQQNIAIGSFINLIRANTQKINPIYLGFVLNSIIGRTQAEMNKSGLAQPYIYSKNLRKFKIPVLPKPIQQKIADLVEKSHIASKKAKELLEEAKQKVEQLIEK